MDQFHFCIFAATRSKKKEKKLSTASCIWRNATNKEIKPSLFRHELKWIVNDYINWKLSAHFAHATEKIEWLYIWIEPNEYIITFWLEKLFFIEVRERE